MIESLSIENLGVIADATLNLGEGLTALSGETGAGKTMALTSLQLILGGKADASKVRSGADAARVEGTFVVSLDSPVLSAIEEAGGTYDVDGDQAVVVVARNIPVQGRSAAFIGGRRVPTAILREIAQELVTVHGQSDQIRLATPAQQRLALDSFGGERIASAQREWAAAYRERNEARAALETFETSARDSAHQRLAFQALVAKVDEVDPQPGEEEDLKRQAHLLENTESRYEALSLAAAYLSGSDSVDSSAISGVDAALRQLEGVDDELARRLQEARDEIGDIAATVALEAAHTEADPERLAQIFARRQTLTALRKELGMGIEEALEAAAQAREELEKLDDPEAARQRLTRRCAESEETMVQAGAQLRSARREAAKELAASIESELHELALAHARFEISVEESEPASHGADTVQFLMAAHSGALLNPIATSASGGELSRVMLAVEVSLASRAGRADHTFLFDEIDAGIGGKAGQSIGRRLAALGSTHQVIVVTHLAQVAAYGRTHAVVVKNDDGTSAKTDVVIVEGDERVNELARMLSGQATQTARAHAAELLSSSDMAR